ncbi:MAG: hypothetical protein KY468_10000 [Armatimonadetes bacterium]|nr:hypothetical protein [Armatimonadota bacterium]
MPPSSESLPPLELIRALADYLRESVRPYLGRVEARKVTATAHSGDATFHVDEIAEAAVAEFLERTRAPVAYYSEDRGLVRNGPAEGILIIDPIDGTRPAAAGFESCVVSIAWANDVETPRMKDVQYGCVRDLFGEKTFLAERGKGARILSGQEEIPPSPSGITDPAFAMWSSEMVGRPAALKVACLEELIDRSSKTGAFFVFNSVAFSLTRLLTGQLDAVVDVGGRILREVPGGRERFAALGRGRPMGLFTYDIAAATLIASEAGLTVTDAAGNSLDEIPLLDTSEENIQSLLAAVTPELHASLLELIERGMAR